MSYSSEDYFLSNEFKGLLDKFTANEDDGAYAMLAPDELIDIAEYYYNGGQRERALEIIDNTLAVYPGSAPPLLFKARIALLDDNDVDGAERYTEMIEDKSDLEYFYMKAEIMLAEGETELADQYLEERFDEIDEDGIIESGSSDGTEDELSMDEALALVDF